MSSVPRQIAAGVQMRANNRCEYCQMHQLLQGATFHLDHIIPTSKGGPTTLDNLALCCPSCNLRKLNRTSVVDSETKATVVLFHPRLDQWTDHFLWSNYELVAITPKAKATIDALKLNSQRRILIRIAEERFGLFSKQHETDQD